MSGGDIFVEKYDREDVVSFLQSRASSYYCGNYLYNLSGVERVQLYQDLEIERIESKYLYIVDQYNHADKDWNQTMWVMLMRNLADKYNKEPFMELAFRVKYSTLLRERDSVENIEAMLIVASGLIGVLPIDEFTDSIHRRGAHLLNKYSIVKMSIDQWNRRNMTASKSHILRFAQVAQLIFSHDLLFNDVISCRKRDDILTLFNVPARDEWMRYYPGATQRRIGVDKRDLFGINVVIPLLYTFGHQTSDEDLTDAAGDLNETIPAEKNYFINGWRESGLNPMIAYESQALIQLASEYCLMKESDIKRRKRGEVLLSRCESCPLFRHMTSRVSILDKLPSFLEI